MTTDWVGLFSSTQTYFAAENISEGGKGVVHGLVVNALIQVLDEDVADSRPTERGIPLAPHLSLIHI